MRRRETIGQTPIVQAIPVLEAVSVSPYPAQNETLLRKNPYPDPFRAQPPPVPRTDFPGPVQRRREVQDETFPRPQPPPAPRTDFPGPIQGRREGNDDDSVSSSHSRTSTASHSSKKIFGVSKVKNTDLKNDQAADNSHGPHATEKSSLQCGPKTDNNDSDMGSISSSQSRKSTLSQTRKQRPCLSKLMNNDVCTNGPHCKFDHDFIVPELAKGKREFCKSFFATGNCKFGKKCWNDHVSIDDLRPKKDGGCENYVSAPTQQPKNQPNAKKNAPRQETNDDLDNLSVSSPQSKKSILSQSTQNSNPKKISFSNDVVEFRTRGACQEFLTKGRCAQGNSCEFDHITIDQLRMKRESEAANDMLSHTKPGVDQLNNHTITTGGSNTTIKDNTPRSKDETDTISMSSSQSEQPLPTNGSKKRPCFSMLKNNGTCTNGPACEYNHDIIVPPLKPGKDGFCMSFLNRGYCEDGARCRYDHISIDQVCPKKESPLPETKAKSEPCSYFAKGNCRNGTNCLYRHDLATAPPRDSNAHKLPIVSPKPTIMNEDVLKEMKVFTAGVEAENRKALTVDLVIVMDCTYSMDPWIAAAKDQIHVIINQVKSKFANCTVNVGFVAYRDFDVRDYRVERLPLTTDIENVSKFIESQNAYGGGDLPEDIPGGLKAALEMNWWGGSRCIVLVTDAPCHGSKYHDRRDSHPKGHPGDPNIEDQMREMAFRGIDFMIIDIDPSMTQKMIALLRTAFETAPLPPDGQRRSFTEVPLAKGEVEAKKAAETLLNSVYQMVNKSIESSCSRTESKLKSAAKSAKSSVAPRTTTILEGNEDEEEDEDDDEDEKEDTSKSKAIFVPIEPQWSTCDNQSFKNAIRHTLWFDPKKLANWDDFESCIQHVRQNTQVKIVRDPFNEGAMRTAHCLEDGKMGGKRLVAKVFKSKKKQGKIDYYHREVKLQCIARALAKSFSLQSPIGVDFIAVSYYELPGLSEDDPFRCFGAEPYMTGEFRKYNNNAGWVTSMDTANASSVAFSLAAQAFSHFTWEHTGGKLHVVDLQGVDNILTDPQIHSAEERGLGSGDLGKAGSSRFFASHVCNEYCRSLNLKPLNSDEGKTTAEEQNQAPPAPEEVRVSCELYCGNTVSLPQEQYRDELSKGREVYCSNCNRLKSDSMKDRNCDKCKKKLSYSVYWYQMKGMAEPRFCKDCRKDSSHDVNAEG